MTGDEFKKAIEEEKPLFEIRCLRCGSTDTQIDNDIRFHESCTTGCIRFICNKCQSWQTVYDPS